MVANKQDPMRGETVFKTIVALCVIFLFSKTLEAGPRYTFVVGQYGWGPEPVVIDAANDFDVQGNGEVGVSKPDKFEWLRAGIVEINSSQELLLLGHGVLERLSISLRIFPIANAPKQMLVASFSVRSQPMSGPEKIIEFREIPVIEGVGAFPQGPPDAESAKSRLFIYVKEIETSALIQREEGK